MYCPQCGSIITDTQKFCAECGSRIPLLKQSPKNESPVSISSSILPDFNAFIDSYISNSTTFTSASSLINGARPLRFKWTIISLLSLFSLISSGLSGVILVLLVSIIAFRTILPFILVLKCSKKYHASTDLDHIDNLAIFLEHNLDSNYFSAWQRGVPTMLGLKDTDSIAVECLFNKKTYHRIIFNKNDLSTYKIETNRPTTKEFLKDGGDNNPNLLYKSDYVVRPILEAAMTYYFQYIIK